MKRMVTVISLLALVIGCQKTNDRFVVHGNGQGGYNMTRVEGDPVEPTSRPTTSPATTDQQRIAELEAELKQSKAENEKLKQASPATNP